ncbi:MAG: hypothetical protein AAFZ65_10940, partial [Planctomycetota bacterium]
MRTRSDERSGFALLTVLLVLLALLILCTPFLWTASNADRTSARLAADAQAELALDTALRHARHELGRSNAGIDPTRFSDSLEELSPRPELAEVRPNHDDPNGLMWSYETRDHSGLIDFDSAPPQVFANLLGQSTFLLERVDEGAGTLRTTGGPGFRGRGVLAVNGEYVRYGRIDGGQFTELERGFLGDEEQECGPWPASGHGFGSPVLGMDAWTVGYWRLGRQLESTAGLALGTLVSELSPMILSGVEGLDESAIEGETGIARDLHEQQLLDCFEPTVTLHGGVAAGSRWQHGTSLTRDFAGDGECILRVGSNRWFNPGATVRISDGRTTVLALVESALGNDRIKLKDPLNAAFRELDTTVEVLARRPVNVNTASPDVLQALFLHLKLRGQNERISRAESEALVARIVDERPFDGIEDFIERLLIPAAGIVPYEELSGLARTNDLDDRRLVLAEALAKRDARIAADPPIIDPLDAQAIVRNALNANDAALEFSTMPLCFTSRDLHEIHARAAINAESGRQRLSAERRQLEWVAPQTDLLEIWTFQEDFDEALRLSRRAPGWGSGPIATTVPDVQRDANPPPRATSYFRDVPVEQFFGDDERGDLSTIEAVASRFPDRGVEGFAKPWHARVTESGARAGAMEHFDQPQTALEGRRTSQNPFDVDLQRFPLVGDSNQIGPTDEPVQMLEPFRLSFWIRPEAQLDGTHLLDMGTTAPGGDRLELFVEPESSELVLRVTDGAGDHPDTAGFTELAELRYEGNGQGPLPVDVWSHVEVDVWGNRPDQLGLRVDGFPVGRRPGFTRLTAPLSSSSTTISVESTEGFPQVGPIVIGEEVVEAVVTGPQTFEATFSDTGGLAGYGGRLAREALEIVGQAGEVPLYGSSSALVKTGEYPVDTPVSIYGYSSPLVSLIPNGSARLNSDLGAWRVARVTGITNASVSEPTGDLITRESTGFNGQGQLFNWGISYGRGFDTALDQVGALRIGTADVRPGEDAQNLIQRDAEALQAFSPDGGYAAVFQVRQGVLRLANGTGEVDGQNPEGAESPVGGLEIISYSGVDADAGLLLVDRWNVTASELASLGGQVPGSLGDINGNHAFVVEWDVQGINVFIVEASAPNENNTLEFSEYPFAMEAALFVVPISLGVDGQSGSFLDPANGRSEFAQLTRLDAEAGQTEWVRYDELQLLNGFLQLVRCEPRALASLFEAVTRQDTPTDFEAGALNDDGGD